MSEFCFVYFVDSKAKVAEAIQKLIIDFEVGSGGPIRTITSGNGSEVCNRRVELLLPKEKIAQQRSAPYTAQQNGRIEREMRTITNGARAMLVRAKLGPELAPEAIRTACYLKNRLPTSKSNRTPYERFTGRKPKLHHLWDQRPDTR
jgi:transposase InsO family protein